MKDLTFNGQGYEFNCERRQLVKRSELRDNEDKSVEVNKVQEPQRPVQEPQRPVQLSRPVRIKKDIVKREVKDTNLDAFTFDLDETNNDNVVKSDDIEIVVQGVNEKAITNIKEPVKVEPLTIEVYRITEDAINKAKSLGQPTKLMKSGLSLIKPDRITIKREDKLDTDIEVANVKKLRHSSNLFNIIATMQYKIAEFDTGNTEFVDLELPDDIGAIIFTDSIGKDGNTLKINTLTLNSSIRYILYQGENYKNIEIADIESNVFTQAFISKFKDVWYYNTEEDLTKEVQAAIVLNSAKIKDLRVWEIPGRFRDILNYGYIVLGDPETQLIKVHNEEFLNKLLNLDEKDSMELDNDAW